MSFAPLNNIATTDDYTAAATIICPGAARINIDAANASILFQIGYGNDLGAMRWQPETFLAPSFRSLDRRADAIRVRSATPAKPARVTVEAIPAIDLP